MIHIAYSLFGFEIIWLKIGQMLSVALDWQPTRHHPASHSNSNYANGGNAKLRNPAAQTAPYWTAYGRVEYSNKATPLTPYSGRGFSVGG